MQAGDLERTFCSLLAGWMSYERLHYSSDRTDMLAPDQPVQLGWRAFVGIDLERCRLRPRPHR